MSPHSPSNGRPSALMAGDDSGKVVRPATLGYARAHMGGKGDRPTVENRWWVDQGKDAKGNKAGDKSWEKGK